MPPLRFAHVETSLGPTWVAETDRGVAAVERGVSLEAFLGPLRRRFPELEPTPADLDAAWLTDALRRGAAAGRRSARALRLRRARLRGRALGAGR